MTPFASRKNPPCSLEIVLIPFACVTEAEEIKIASPETCLTFLTNRANFQFEYVHNASHVPSQKFQSFRVRSFESCLETFACKIYSVNANRLGLTEFLNQIEHAHDVTPKVSNV